MHARSNALLLLASSLFHLAARAQAPAQADRVVLAADASARTRIVGHVPDWVATPDAHVADAGSVPGTQAVSLMFGVSRSPELQAAFDQLLADQQNPASPRYRQFLTPQQIGEQYGPTQHDLDALTAWLTSQGFHVDSITPSRIFVQATAPAELVSAALHTPLHHYTRSVAGKTELLQAPTAEPTLPQALAPIVATIGGLVNVPLHSDLKILPPMLNTQTNIRAPHPVGQVTAAIAPDMTLSGGTHYIAPADFTVLYDLQPMYSASITGSGQKIMIIGGSRLYPQDLSLWESDSGLAAYTPNYIVPSGQTDPGTTNDDNMGEGTLDFERSYATAPGATIDMVIAANWLSGTISNQLITYAINTVNDPILSMSFSSCEINQGQANVLAENTLYAQAAAQGISVFASSGDSGVAGCEPHGVAAPTAQIASISDICATGNVTCVGGTEFADTATPASYWSSINGTGYESVLSYIPEGAWNEPTSTNGSGATIYVVGATGGGPSIYIAKPSWQTGSGVPADGHRDTPDVSFSASLHNGYFSCLNYTGASCVVTNGSFSLTGFGGTSATAPSMAGVAALLDQKLGKRAGNLNPTLYSVATSTPSAFHDATPASSLVGSACSTATPNLCNNSNPSPTALTGGIAGYALGTGYDLPTGLGSLDVSKFITAAYAVLAGSVTMTPASSSLTVTAGSGATDVVTVTSQNFSGTQTLTCSVTYNGSGTVSDPPGCSFSPGALTFGGSGGMMSTVTISSTAASALTGGGVYKSENRLRGLAGFGGAAFAALLLVGLPRRTRIAAGSMRLTTLMLLLVAGMATLSGCGSSSSSSSSNPGTTKGSYDVNISTNSALNQTGNVGFSTFINLTIQ